MTGTADTARAEAHRSRRGALRTTLSGLESRMTVCASHRSARLANPGGDAKLFRRVKRGSVLDGVIAGVSTDERLKMALAGVREKRCVTGHQAITVFAGGCCKDTISRITRRHAGKKR